jgi:hypothetical protein
MKLHLCLCVIASTPLLAQTLPPTDRFRSAGYSLSEEGAHYRVWSREVLRTNEFSQAYLATNRFVEVSPGIGYWTGSNWVTSSPELIQSTNGILARGAGHSAWFSSNINTRASVRIRDAQGQVLQTHLIGLAYQDLTTGTNVLIAEPRNAGPVTGTNRAGLTISYPDCLDGASADVIYTFSRSGVSQDVRLKNKLPLPQDFSLSTNSDLLVITEVASGPAPTLQQNMVHQGPRMVNDVSIDFGAMRMVQGFAFRSGHGHRRSGAIVAKEFAQIGDRRFIIERLPWARAAVDMANLPPEGVSTNTTGVTNASLRRVMRYYAKGAAPAPAKPAGALLADARPARPDRAEGYTIDWSYADDTSIDFFCGSTYLVVGEVHLTSADIPPATVWKFAPDCDPPSSLYIDGALSFPAPSFNCGTAKPTFTVATDQTVGEDVGYYDTPADGQYGPALAVWPPYLTLAQEHTDLLYNPSPGIQSIPSTVVITAPIGEATKGGDNGTFQITRLDGDTVDPLTVYVSIVGTAVAGQDYQAISGAITIPANQQSVAVSVIPTASSGVAYERSVILSLLPDTNGTYTVATPSSSAVYIFDPTAARPAPITAPAGAVAFWHADNSAADATSTNNGTMLHGGGYTNGYVSQGFLLDGVSQHVRVADNAVLRFTNALTVEGWVYPTGYGWIEILSKWDAVGGPNTRSYGIGLYPDDGRLYLVVSPGGTDAGAGVAGSTNPVPQYEWTHFAATYDGTSLDVYLNGALDGTLPYSSGVYAGTADLAIGGVVGGTSSGGGISFFPGRLDEMTLYYRALTTNEIQAIYAAGRGGKILDSDGDGLPDDWERAYFGNLSQGPNGDFDGDGLSNFQEWILGTNPTNAAAPDTTGTLKLQVFTPLK